MSSPSEIAAQTYVRAWQESDPASRARLIDECFADDGDAQGPIVRFRSVVEDRDGRVVFDGFDAAEVDAEGRITVLLTFGASATPFP